MDTEDPSKSRQGKSCLISYIPLHVYSCSGQPNLWKLNDIGISYIPRPSINTNQDKMPLSCRYYKERYPEVDEVVMVNVKRIAEMGAYVHLLEYNNIEGMILLSELSRRRIRSVNKLIRIGKTEPVVVIRVDKEKGNPPLISFVLFLSELINLKSNGLNAGIFGI